MTMTTEPLRPPGVVVLRQIHGSLPTDVLFLPDSSGVSSSRSLSDGTGYRLIGADLDQSAGELTVLTTGRLATGERN